MAGGTPVKIEDLDKIADLSTLDSETLITIQQPGQPTQTICYGDLKAAMCPKPFNAGADDYTANAGDTWVVPSPAGVVPDPKGIKITQNGQTLNEGEAYDIVIDPATGEMTVTWNRPMNLCSIDMDFWYCN